MLDFKGGEPLLWYVGVGAATATSDKKDAGSGKQRSSRFKDTNLTRATTQSVELRFQLRSLAPDINRSVPRDGGLPPMNTSDPSWTTHTSNRMASPAPKQLC